MSGHTVLTPPALGKAWAIICLLQIKRGGGAWRDVLAFNQSEIDEAPFLAAAARMVIEADPAGQLELQVAVDDVQRTVLSRWTRHGGWVHTRHAR